MAKEKLITLIKSLGFTVVSEDILVSNCPISALVFRKDKFFFVEYLFKNNLGFVEKHFDWIKYNINLFRSKYKLKNLAEINLLCLSFTEDELNLEVPGFEGELVICRCPLKEGSGELLPFNNWTFNRDYFKNRIAPLLPKMPREEVDIFKSFFTIKPLFVKEEFKDYFFIQAQGEEYRLRLFKDFVWLHKGPAPFRPRKILIKSVVTKSRC